MTKQELEEELSSFLPSLDGLEKDLQEVAATLECTDLEFLPESLRKGMQQPGARTALQRRFLELRAQLR